MRFRFDRRISYIFWGLVVGFCGTMPVFGGETDTFTNRYPIVRPELVSERSVEVPLITKAQPIKKPARSRARVIEAPLIKEAQPIPIKESGEWEAVPVQGKNVRVEQSRQATPRIVQNPPALYLVPDSLQGLNELMNKSLDEAADFRSSRADVCDVSSLIRRMLDAMAGEPIAKIERWVTKDGIDSYFAYNKKNRYGTIHSETSVWACCSNVLKVNGVYLGSDKLGHFFKHGYQYYEISKRTQTGVFSFFESHMHPAVLVSARGLNGVGGAFEHGENQESGLWGLRSTGVHSYGDLAANADGLRFWRQLTEGAKPYFVCSDGKWKRVRDFDWSEYVSDAWDEAINCSHFENEEIEKAVALRVAELQRAAERPVLTCPVEPDKCKALPARYGDHAKRVLSPECLQAASGVKSAPRPLPVPAKGVDNAP